MKKKILSVALSIMLVLSNIVCYATNGDTDINTYEDVFVKDKIIDINIEIRDADLQDMYDYATNEEYHSADITIDGVKVENAGIRTKGNMTLSSVANSDSDRYSFRIKFNKYVKGQTFLGLDELCLNNGYSDATYMREYLHYEILEELGMNVPNRAFCNVYINGELFGFYLAVEAIDDTFLEREFGENYENGNLYKMDMGSTLEYKEDENYTYADFKSGTDKDLAEFKSFVKKLNEITDGEKGNIEDFLNVESALKYIASNTVLCNYDSYNGNNHHNFYLYEDENGVFTIVPWDFNMSFGGFNGKNSTVGIDTPFISGSLETLPLIGKLLSIDEYKEQYYGYIKEVMNMLEDFEERVTELKEIIEPYVKNDPTSFYSFEDFEKSTTIQNTDAKETEISKESSVQDELKNNQREQWQPNNEHNPGGGQPFGGTDSIINCIADRLSNLNEQFAGTAEKSTQTSDDRDGGRPGENFVPPESYNNNMPGNFTPPQFGENGQNSDNFQPPESKKDGEMPDNFTPTENDNNRSDPKHEDFQNGSNPNQNGNPPENVPPNEHNGKEKNNIIRVHINGHIIAFDTSPVIENDTTLVGFRSILEALGATVSWNEESKTVTATKDDTVIKLAIGSDTAYVNDEAQVLLAAPIIIENSTMIPVRFISEQLGMKVSWDGETKLITISSK